jgi:hypothetical protein
VRVSDWTPDELQTLVRLREEFEPQGVLYLRTVGSPEWGIYVPADLVPHVRQRLANVVAAAPDRESLPLDPRRSKPGRGRRRGEVSEVEASKVAGIYMKGRKVFQRASDKGAYAVRKQYIEHANGPPLSRPMIAHLIAALEDAVIVWDEREGALKIPDEFRTGPGSFVIPRRDSASGTV